MSMLITDVKSAVEQWGSALEVALRDGDESLLAELFLEESYYRDNGALTWSYRQYHGFPAFSKLLLGQGANRPRNLRLTTDWPAPHITGDDSPVVTAYFHFDTDWGSGVALLNAVPDETAARQIKARVLFTRLSGVNDVEREPDAGSHRTAPLGAGQDWAEMREHQRSYRDHDPDVLVVGAGQSGLMVAAHLDHLGVPTLVIDKEERVGDNWRTRYASLYLHNPTQMNGFPFLPYPDHYPEYLPKDVIGDWLEVYAKYLDLNVWTRTEFLEAAWEDDAQVWRVTVRQRDGSIREIRPRHIVQASGATGGTPKVPEITGIETCAGEVVHSAHFVGAAAHAARHGAGKALVVGMGSSGHDVALDLHRHGFDVTMLQRSPVIVQNVETANLAYAAYFDGVTPVEVVDIQYGVALVNPLRIAGSKAYHQFAKDKDAELLEGLTAAGVVLGEGPDGAGWLAEFLRTGGGYYLNVGASEVIIEGGIKVLQSNRVTSFTRDGAQLDDGTVLAADLVVLATGYQNRIADIARQFGSEVAQRLGPIARLDAEGEWTNMWRPTAVEGLWFTGGGINQVRPNSKVLALLVKAHLLGIVPEPEQAPLRAADPEPDQVAGRVSDRTQDQDQDLHRGQSAGSTPVLAGRVN